MRTPKTTIRVVAGLTSAALVAATASQMLGPMLEQTTTETLRYPVGAERVEIGNGVGSVSVRAAAEGEEPHVEVSRTWGLTEPRTTAVEDGSTARFSGHCTTGLKLLGDVCQTDWVLVVPRGVDLSVENGVGDVEVEGTSGELSARSGVGQVRVIGTSSDRVDVSSGVGEVRVEATEAPEQLDVEVGVGGITIGVPRRESYRVTSEGPPSMVKNQVGDDPTAEHRIHVRIGVGEATIAGR